MITWDRGAYAVLVRVLAERGEGLLRTVRRREPGLTGHEPWMSAGPALAEGEVLAPPVRGAAKPAPGTRQTSPPPDGKSPWPLITAVPTGAGGYAGSSTGRAGSPPLSSQRSSLAMARETEWATVA
ncbi:hypothetical protein SCWH03_41400 [Streptomyces pacificus]|uniref:Uncharacterized protein n=1 Tax=Streptomyces pacificus TaxID=2705029 RepID=A0A6A0AY77_9ACTN|nr:hypothetical protein SCWH03_41400 [Streptomyces pacificus]